MILELPGIVAEYEDAGTVGSVPVLATERQRSLPGSQQCGSITFQTTTPILRAQIGVGDWGT